MFSKSSRSPARLELVFTGENFKWCEDETVVRQQEKQRTRRFVATCTAIALAAFVLGQSFGVAWLLTAAANSKFVMP